MQKLCKEINPPKALYHRDSGCVARRTQYRNVQIFQNNLISWL